MPLQGNSGRSPEATASEEALTPAIPPTTYTQLEVAFYVETMCAELKAMARSAELDGLAYFLEMARIEASIQIERRATST